MCYKKIIIFLLFITLGSVAVAEEPKIIKVKGKYRLQLNNKMETALKEKSPTFKQYLPEHFPTGQKRPWTMKNYKINKKQMISAVVADFNGDGKKDVVILGADNQGDVAYKIISDNKSYVVSEFGSRFGDARSIPPLYKEDADWKYGMKYLEYRPIGSSFVNQKSETIKCPYESISITQNADGERAYPYCWIEGDLVVSVSGC